MINENAKFVNNYNYKNIHASEVAYIRYYKNYPLDKFKNGAIMVYTTGVYGRNKDMGVSKIQRSRTPGYSAFSDYHAPNYSLTTPADYDDRQTLYWNPDLAVQAGESTPIEFYNNSISKSFYITIKGVSRSGKKIQFSKHINEIDGQITTSIK